MSIRPRRALPATTQYLDHRIDRWRTGTTEGQIAVLVALLVLNAVILVCSLLSYSTFPAASFVVTMVLGQIWLRWRPLAVLIGVTIVCTTVTVLVEANLNGMSTGRRGTLIVMAIVAAIMLFESSRHRSGLPGPLGESMLVDLRDRLQAQGVIPELPDGWRSQSAVKSAGGLRFAGDFIVANLSDDESSLDIVLVDVSGKGVAAATHSLHFAGALGGLIGSLPPLGLFAAANDFLLRQNWTEGFATAVHVSIDLETGAYTVINAGHPPVLRWDARRQEWDVDSASGMALGIARMPEFEQSEGVLEAGCALMLYTDGVVESRKQEFSDGIEWLRETSGAAVREGFDNAARRILAKVAATDDDRAVLIVSREA